MRPTPRLAIASLLALPLAACGSVAAVPGISPDLAPQELARSICPAAYRCCMTDQLMDNAQAGTDEATCETKTQASFEQYVAGLKASEKKGRVIYDGLKVEACVSFLKSADCSELQKTGHFTGIPACQSFIQPRVVVGGPCAQSFECVAGFCDRTGVADGDDGVCRAFARQGESCAGGVACDAALLCDGGTMKCVPLPAGGQQDPNAKLCFYSSACNASGGDRGAASLLAVGLLLLAIAVRRRAPAPAPHTRSR